MLFHTNACHVAGTVEGQPTVSHTKNGAPYGGFTLVLNEPSPHRRPHAVSVQIEVWGKRVEQVKALRPGMIVLVQGKLDRRRLPGGQWQLYVDASTITVVEQADQTTASYQGEVDLIAAQQVRRKA